MQQHRSMCFYKCAGPASDGKSCICTVVKEWPLDSDLSLSKESRPEALPFGLTGRNGTGALSIVCSYLLLVGCIEDGVMEAKNVTQRQMPWMKLLHRIRDCMLNNVNDLLLIRAGTRRRSSDMQGKEHTCQ